MVFNEYDIPLPRLTNVVFRASHAQTVFISLILVLAGADWFVLEKLSKRGDALGASSWSAIMIATPLLLIALTLAAPFCRS